MALANDRYAASDLITIDASGWAISQA